jgi:hypothetical protein
MRTPDDPEYVKDANEPSRSSRHANELTDRFVDRGERDLA